MHYSFHAEQLRGGKFGCDNRNTDGERLCRFYVYSSAVRTFGQFDQFCHNADISAYFRCLDDKHDRTHVPTDEEKRYIEYTIEIILESRMGISEMRLWSYCNLKCGFGLIAI